MALEIFSFNVLRITILELILLNIILMQDI